MDILRALSGITDDMKAEAEKALHEMAKNTLRMNLKYELLSPFSGYAAIKQTHVDVVNDSVNQLNKNWDTTKTGIEGAFDGEVQKSARKAVDSLKDNKEYDTGVQSINTGV